MNGEGQFAKTNPLWSRPNKLEEKTVNSQNFPIAGSRPPSTILALIRSRLPPPSESCWAEASFSDTATTLPPFVPRWRLEAPTAPQAAPPHAAAAAASAAGVGVEIQHCPSHRFHRRCRRRKLGRVSCPTPPRRHYPTRRHPLRPPASATAPPHCWASTMHQSPTRSLFAEDAAVPVGFWFSADYVGRRPRLWTSRRRLASGAPGDRGRGAVCRRRGTGTWS